MHVLVAARRLRQRGVTQQHTFDPVMRRHTVTMRSSAPVTRMSSLSAATAWTCTQCVDAMEGIASLCVVELTSHSMTRGIEESDREDATHPSLVQW